MSCSINVCPKNIKSSLIGPTVNGLIQVMGLYYEEVLRNVESYAASELADKLLKHGLRAHTEPIDHRMFTLVKHINGFHFQR